MVLPLNLWTLQCDCVDYAWLWTTLSCEFSLKMLKLSWSSEWLFCVHNILNDSTINIYQHITIFNYCVNCYFKIWNVHKINGKNLETCIHTYSLWWIIYTIGHKFFIKNALYWVHFEVKCVCCPSMPTRQVPSFRLLLCSFSESDSAIFPHQHNATGPINGRGGTTMTLLPINCDEM